ncbi:hypothetical protein HKBW3S42_02243, partial [Candidatus Hakubella thermalkaliphila]
MKKTPLLKPPVKGNSYSQDTYITEKEGLHIVIFRLKADAMCFP